MSKVPQAKDKDFDMITPNIGFTDMTDEDQLKCFDICREAYSRLLFIYSYFLSI